jgi:hypothetical protein
MASQEHECLGRDGLPLGVDVNFDVAKDLQIITLQVLCNCAGLTSCDKHP